MNKKDKDLLLNDLCGRLPYEVILEVSFDTEDSNESQNPYPMVSLSADGVVIETDYHRYNIPIEKVKPYLRPMEDMTGDEMKYVNETFFKKSDHFMIDDCGEMFVSAQPFESVYTLALKYQAEYFDWLNSRHFDYRRLIEKGLALKADDTMYDSFTKKLTRGEREAIYKEICRRMPYGVIVRDENNYNPIKKTYDYEAYPSMLTNNDLEGLRPYLRSIDKITPKEKEYIKKHSNILPDFANTKMLFAQQVAKLTKYLDSHMIDYDNMIAKGLALEAPEGLYDVENFGKEVSVCPL